MYADKGGAVIGESKAGAAGVANDGTGVVLASDGGVDRCEGTGCVDVGARLGKIGEKGN